MTRFAAYTVPSESEPGGDYTVCGPPHGEDGAWSCTCKGFARWGRCKHVDKLKGRRAGSPANRRPGVRYNSRGEPTGYPWLPAPPGTATREDVAHLPKVDPGVLYTP